MFALVLDKHDQVVGQLERIDGVYKGYVQPSPRSLPVPVQLQSIDQLSETRIAIGDGEVYHVVYVTEPLASLGTVIA